MSADVIATALQSLVVQLEPPGIDIRPSGSDREDHQTVRYFGGVHDTTVGIWFFRFDHWLKRAALEDLEHRVHGMPSYWRHVIDPVANAPPDRHRPDSNISKKETRFWLCAPEFDTVEDTDVLMFKAADLIVLLETLAANETTSPSSCAAGGKADPHARAFADWLTVHQDQLADHVPIEAITNFARLLAGFAWLREKSPYRSLHPWINKQTSTTKTPLEVPTISRSGTIRSNPPSGGGNRVFRIELSGGVILDPRLVRLKSGDGAARRLLQTVIDSRPSPQSLQWPFRFTRYPQGSG